MSTPEGKFRGEIPQEAVARNSVLILGFQIATKLLGFVSAVLLANYLGTSRFGVYSYAFALTSLFIPLCDLGLDIFLLRDIPRNDTLQGTKDFGSVLVSKTLLAAMVLLLIVITGAFMESWGSEHFIYVLLAGIVTILKAFWTTFSSVLRALNRVAAEAGLFIASRFGEFVVTIICIVAHQTIGTLLILLVIVNGFALASTFYYVSRRYLRPQLQVSIPQLRHIFREGMPYALTTIFTAIYFNFDTVLVSKLVSDRSAGLYRAVYNLILPMMMVTASVTGAVFPFVSQNIRQFPQRAYELIRRSSRYLLLMGLPLAVFGCIESKNVVSFLFAPEYAESAVSLSILVWFLPVVYITNLYGNLLGAMDQQWFVLRITTVNVMFNIIANVILIPMFAQNGASVVTVLTELLGLVFLSTRMRRQVPSLIQISFFFRACLAMVPSALVLFLFPRLYLPLLILIAGVVYVVSIILVKALPVNELNSLRNNLRGSHATN